MIRKASWPEILDRAVDEAHAAAFVWGGHDCCLWPLRTIDAMCGTHLAALLTHTNEAEAAALIAQIGAWASDATPLDRAATNLARAHGIPEIAPLFAQRGDVVLAGLDHGPTLGLCLGAQAGFVAPGGLLRLPLRMCRRAWRIG